MVEALVSRVVGTVITYSDSPSQQVYRDIAGQFGGGSLQTNMTNNL